MQLVLRVPGLGLELGSGWGFLIRDFSSGDGWYLDPEVQLQGVLWGCLWTTHPSYPSPSPRQRWAHLRYTGEQSVP